MRTLYPDIAPYETGTLKVDDRHTLYWEQCGNPEGKPVVLLHGGPGAGCNEKMRRFHDPAKYRIILFDQRGAGRSTPHADLTDNSTWHLVADIEKLRNQLGIARWQVFGGSWGSTLALAYAQAHPQRVTELVLRGIFMLRRWELEWFYQEGANRLFPDAWAHYLEAIPPVERHDLISAFHRRLTSDDEATRRRPHRNRRDRDRAPPFGQPFAGQRDGVGIGGPEAEAADQPPGSHFPNVAGKRRAYRGEREHDRGQGQRPPPADRHEVGR